MDDSMPLDQASERQALEFALARLNDISNSTTKSVALVVVLTLTNIVGPLVLAIAGEMLSGNSIMQKDHYSTTTFCISLVLAAFNVLLLWRFDQLARVGEGLMQEISDWVEVEARSSGKALNVRLAIREFLARSALPFVARSAEGRLVYVLVNIATPYVVWLAIRTLN